MSKRVIFTAACAIAVAAVAGSAMAQSEFAAARSVFHEQVAVPVSYADLDLSSPDGASLMLHRLHDAALNACGADDSSVRPYKWAVHRSACYRDSMDRAVADLNAPAVTRLYQSRAADAFNG